MSSIDLWYVTRATGIVALVLLSATMALGILTDGRARSVLPTYARMDLHRRLSVITVIFLAIHVLTSVLDSYVHINPLALLIPFAASHHAFWLALGTVGVDLFLAVGVSSALRHHISPRSWRLIHWPAYGSSPVAVAHSLGMGTDSKLNWVLGLDAACIAIVSGAVLWRILDAIRTRAALPSTLVKQRRTIRPNVGLVRAGKGAL